MPTLVHDVELPEVDVFGLGRESLITAFERARERHWLARVPLGHAVTRYEDVA